MSALARTVARASAKLGSKIPIASGYLSLFLMVLAPTAFTTVKALLVIVTAGAIVISLVRNNRMTLHPQVLMMTLLFVSGGLLFTLVGSFNANPGVISMTPLFVAWPIAFIALVAGLDTASRLDRMVQVLVFATIAIAATMYHFLLTKEGVLPKTLYVDLGLGLRANADLLGPGRITEFDGYGIASLLFLVPFLIASLLVWPDRAGMPLRRTWLWVAFALSFPLVLLSGRRGLWLAVGMAPIAALIARAWLRRGTGARALPWRQWLMRGVPAVIALLTALWVIADLTPNKIADWLGRGFALPGGRKRQLDALVDGWLDEPLLGKGLGAVARVIRSNSQPWAYELAYASLLFATGVVGIALFLYGLSWIIRSSRTMIRERNERVEVLLSLLIGTLGIIVASATNPYITKFDALWTIFVPIAFINHWLRTRTDQLAPGVMSARGATATRD